MLYDAAGPDRARFTDPATPFDVCVVGTGPAGITLARRLAGRGLSVALMEAGGLEFSAESQDVYAGENVGHDYYDLDTARLRFLGGTSGHWGGRCRTLDAWDFEPRAGDPLSGWPIAKADLDPYQPDADAVLELPAGGSFVDLPGEVGPDFRPDFRGVAFRQSPPTRFGERYLDELTAAERISLGLNANLVDLRLGADLATVEGAVFRSYAPDDPGFTVRARAYALAAGGIETPRLLLNFTSQKPAGIGNDHDLVGRFFCEHPHLYVGDAEFEAPRTEEASFAPTPEFMAAHGVLNFVLMLTPRDRVPPLALGDALTRSARCVAPFTERLAERVLGGVVDCESGGVEDYLQRRSYVPGTRGALRINSEQSLLADSRVMLGDARDTLGLRRSRLDWRVAERDLATIVTAARGFGESMATAGLGRLRLRDWMLEDPVALPTMDQGEGRVGGWHHMCTTRMSADPRAGVVDADARVHGTANLWIGGSSVFATPGCANPTYTIVQLALRLGDHLAATSRA